MFLRSQSIFDLQSREMLDIIFDTIIYDTVDLYSGGDMDSRGALMNDLHCAMSYDDSSTVSDYKGNVRVTKHCIKALIKAADGTE
ncbi:MAG: hypothetical protein IKG80_04255 [Clostridia bacterium]|nr:hypothetical protein [Clostridia bacterium]